MPLEYNFGFSYHRFPWLYALASFLVTIQLCPKPISDSPLTVPIVFFPRFSSVHTPTETASCMSRDCMRLIRCNKTFVIYASVELHNCITWNFYLWPFAAASQQYYSLVQSTSTHRALTLLRGNMDLECVEWSSLVRVRISYCSFISRCKRVEEFHSMAIIK